MLATGLVYQQLGGEFRPVVLSALAKPLVAAISAYFFVNTGVIAGAIALTSGRTVREVWMQDFAWSGSSFMVAGSAGAAAAVVISRGEQWPAILLLAPVYLTYKTYQVFVGRLQDRDRHAAEARQLQLETANALSQAQEAEKALAVEKDLLAETVGELRRLEKVRKDLLESERAARASAEEGNRIKDQFLATVSHELRTPLNAILGWADMLRLPAIDNGTRDRASKSIYENARQQARMIDELLDVARIVSGKLLLERTEVDLERIVCASIEIVEAAAEARQVAIVVDADRSNDVVYGDASRLQQIVWNLLSNAVKFSDQGGRVVVRLRRANSKAELAVTDDGIGIPPEFLSSVFEPFRQADASSTRRYGGLGLGLSIVKHMTEAHGGTITAFSEGPTRGATFIVRLPTRPSVGRGVSAEHRDPAASAHRRDPGGYRPAGRRRLHLHQAGSSPESQSVDNASGSPHRARERGRPAASAPFRVSAAPSETRRSGFARRSSSPPRAPQPAIDVRKNSFLRPWKRGELRRRA